MPRDVKGEHCMRRVALCARSCTEGLALSVGKACVATGTWMHCHSGLTPIVPLRLNPQVNERVTATRHNLLTNIERPTSKFHCLRETATTTQKY